MASCPKCGKIKVSKRPNGPRSCKRCGVLLGALGWFRNGELGAYPNVETSQ